MTGNDILYLVIPCYNEEAVLHETAKQLLAKMNSMFDRGMISRESKIMFVNDGSRDKTWEIIKELHESNPIYSGVKLSRNKGHQNALLAGLMTAKEKADMAISLDADLQDDVDVIDQMVEKYYEGNDVVYGVRSARDTDTFFKKFTAEGFYKIMQAMGVEIVFNHADYRLMSRRALEGLSEFREVNLFLRGIVPLIGYKSDIVTYERHERFAGESKYPLKKMLAFATDGITSFSIKPIRMITSLRFPDFRYQHSDAAVFPGGSISWAEPYTAGPAPSCLSGPSADCSFWPSGLWVNILEKFTWKPRRVPSISLRPYWINK